MGDQMLICLCASLLSGGVMGAITVFLEKPVIVFCTSAIGAALTMVGMLIFSPVVGMQHMLGWIDLIIALILLALFAVLQYFVIPDPPAKKPKEVEEYTKVGMEDNVPQ